ncbi:hypothetical protein PB1_05085 [Bacillus methanolicus PB1]|uniref:Uncharacterized protein n=1 Tax=Bacillus methanolicus PB1 TaxID=997296 RepID=I3E706_BACMT|nr:hypothetical protein [Bacillus methanolicus]EIJ82277.1 hypothetical protein PB1_05085 [Bacillus methanolicus PB1]
MDAKVKELVDFTKDKFGLEHYHLHTVNIYRDKNILNSTNYTLSMEWYPNNISEHTDENCNPVGTAVIDLDINSRRFKRIIFVGGTSLSVGLKFNKNDINEIIRWIEKETGLLYGKQFTIWKQEELNIHFEECFNGIPVSPSGYIYFELDKNGRLTLFSVNGLFPSKEMVKEETFSLTLKDLEQTARDQVKLLEFPSSKQEKWIPIYGLEEIYIKNDKTGTIPIEPIADVRPYLKIDKILSWDNSILKPFIRREINLSSETITIEQALSREPHPDTFPITKVDQDKSIEAVLDFLRKQYPDDSGKWKLTYLFRDNGYINAILKPLLNDLRVYQRKLMIFIDTNTFEAANYIDNQLFLDMFHQYTSPENITIRKEEAFEKIKTKIELKPVYVYDFEQKKYVLCGKLDCEYGVLANNGDVIELEDI